jgi:hypothetical protein
MSVEESLEVACGGVWPDVILHGMDFKESGIPLLTGLPGAPAITALELQDSWAVPERQIEFINSQRFDLGLLIVRHHIPYYQKHCPGTQFLWVPHAVNTALFKNYRLPKVYDVLLYGITNAHTYPLRARIAQLLNKSALRFRWIPHPGYYPLQGGGNPGVVAGADLSREINQSWITIATSSIYQCLMMKYFEIAASYSLIAGDMPEEGQLIFGNDFIRLSNEQSDEQILSTLQRNLACKDRLLAMTNAAHRRITQNYSTDMFADRLLNDFRIIKAAKVRDLRESSSCRSLKMSSWVKTSGSPTQP